MYKYRFHPEAKKELTKLNHSIQLLFTKTLKKILKSPELGQVLGNRAVAKQIIFLYNVIKNDKKLRNHDKYKKSPKK